MTADNERIRTFLQQARSRALLEVGIRTGGHAGVWLAVVLLALALAALLAGPAVSWPYFAVGAIAACVAGGIALGFVYPSRALEPPTEIARLVGKRYPPLASDLLSAVELRERGTAESSSEMVDSFCEAVADATRPVDVEALIPLDRAVRAVAMGALCLLALLVGALASPGLGRGMRTLFRTPTMFEGSQAVRGPLVGDVRITYDFPPYTGLARQTIEGSTGDLHAVRGTKVRIQMRPLRSARQARLLLGETGESGSITGDLHRGNMTVELALEESGAYRVWLRPFLGRPVREENPHRIAVDADQPPEVDIVGAADHLELAAPRPVEVGYHARDDFGLSEVALVYRVNEGPEQRVPLKNARGAREVRGTTMFEPASAMLTPGARVAYHVEATDRDDVSGNKTGVSRTLTLVVQNPRQDLEEHLERERDILEKLVVSLADRVELDDRAEPRERLTRLREVHDSEAVGLAGVARLIEQHRNASGMNKVLTAALVAAMAKLGKLQREEEDLLGALAKSPSNAPGWARLPSMLARHTNELEGAVLALDDLIGRQRLDDLAGIGKELVDAHKRLQDLLERYKATGDEQLRRQIEREVRELRARIAELAQKIAEVKARNEVSPDFMNMPDAHKAMEEAARLDSLLAKGDARALGDALAELGQSLSSLRDLLDKNAGDFSASRFPQESRAAAELARKLGDMEGDQRSLASDEHALAKEIDGELGRRIEAQQAEFVAKAKQKLEQIQRKIAGPLPREMGSSAETATGSVRENLRQLHRLLPAKEWSEAEREVERMGVGLGHLQHLSARQLAMGRPPSANLLAYDNQVDEAAALARALAAELAKAVPRGGEVMSPEQRARAETLSKRQGSIEEKARGLSRELGGKSEAVPGAEGSAAELEEIAGQMRQAGQDMQQGDAHEGAGRAEDVADRLAKLRERMGQRPSDGSRPSREPVRIPDAEASKAPREWRQELMEAMREKAPEKFRDEVRHYYEELVR